MKLCKKCGSPLWGLLQDADTSCNCSEGPKGFGTQAESYRQNGGGPTRGVMRSSRGSWGAIWRDNHKAARELRGLLQPHMMQKDVAKRLGMTRSNVERVEITALAKVQRAMLDQSEDGELRLLRLKLEKLERMMAELKQQKENV